MISNRNSLMQRVQKNALFANSSRLTALGEPTVLRICWVDGVEDEVGVIAVNVRKSNPMIISLDALLSALQAGTARFVEVDSWMPRLPPPRVKKESSKNKKRHEQEAAERYEWISAFVEKNRREFFIASTRSKLICELVSKQNKSKPWLYELIRRYFARGASKFALILDYQNCGAAGKSRKVRKKRVGRPYQEKNKPSSGYGFVVTEEIKEILATAWQKLKIKGKLSRNIAYQKMLGIYFAVGYKQEHGVPKPILPPKGKYPSIMQFVYWGKSPGNYKRDMAMQDGEKKFVLKSRASIGSARENIMGPGSQYQIDATGTVVHLVSRRNRNLRIGKGILYLIIDVYSQYIVGWSLTLENASFAAMMTAFERAFTDKSEYCRALGFPITWEEWPAVLVCDTVLGDCGSELLGYQSDNISEALEMTFSQAPPGRPEWKSYVESSNSPIKTLLRSIDGASKKRRERGEKDPADDACLTLDDLEKIIVPHLLRFNHTHKMDNHPDAIHLHASGVSATPHNLWVWGLANRSGSGRTHDRSYIRAALLPKREISATRNGLRFANDLLYMSKVLDSQGAFLRVKGMKQQRVWVAYDPRDLSEIYLLDEKFRVIENCPLTPKSAHHRGISLWEYESQNGSAAPITVLAETRKLEFDIAVNDNTEKVLKEARKRSAKYSDPPEFSDEERQRELAERRRETSWTSSQEPSSRDELDLQYVPEEDYFDDGEPI